MPRDASGAYTLPTNDSSPAAPRNVIRSSDFNELTGDYATALTESLWNEKNLADLADIGTAQDNIQLGVSFVSVAIASAATIPARNKRLRTQFYAPNYAVPDSLVGGAQYRRASLADLGSYPALSYFRSNDRFMPDGSTDNTNGGYWVIDEPTLLLAMFGVIGSGIETAKVKAAFDTSLVQNVELDTERDAYVLPFTTAVGKARIYSSGGVIRADASYVNVDVYDNHLINFPVGVNKADISLKMDLGGKHLSGVSIRGDDNKISLVYANSAVPVGAVRSDRGVEIAGSLDGVSGNRNEIVSVRSMNATSPAGDGLVFSTAVAVTGYARDTVVGTVWAVAGASALVNNGHRTRAGFLYVDGTLDNAIYDIEDAVDLYVETLVALNCPDEVCVFRGDLRPRINNLYAQNCGRGLGIASSTDPSAGTIVWTNDGSVDGGSPIYVRNIAGAAANNSLKVGRLEVSGTWETGAPFITADSPLQPVSRLEIGEIVGDLYYTAGATRSLWFLSQVQELHFGRVDIKVRDDVTGGGISAGFPAALATPSMVGSLQLLGVGTSAPTFTVANREQINLTIEGGNRQAASYTTTATGVTNISAVTPQSTRWMRSGNTLTIWGGIQVTATAAAAFSFEITLPVSATFAFAFDGGGTFSSGDAAVRGSVSINTANGRLRFDGAATTTSARNCAFSVVVMLP